MGNPSDESSDTGCPPGSVDAGPYTAESGVLRAVLEATRAGDDLLERLTSVGAALLGANDVSVAQFAAPSTARTVARWRGDAADGQVEGPPAVHEPARAAVARGDEIISAEGVVLPLRDWHGNVVGAFSAAWGGNASLDHRRLTIARLLAARAETELARRVVGQEHLASEERLRDLFDEAPIAYVNEGLDSRFIRANRAALRTLGIAESDVPHTFGFSFVPDTPDAQRRLRDAFESIGRGTDTSGVVLELRRKDTGKPLWIQWWSRPDPSGTYTRTMFLDITDRVLMEQEQARLREQNLYLREEIKSVHNFDEIVGRSAPLAAVLDSVRRVAATDSSVLITGETGTGKELIARAIHSASRRHDRPLIKLNCAALPTALVESELFGHEKGAFSGAVSRRVGRFELAHGGTIFLDEIGEMPHETQVKLLRVLQEREFERVGGSLPIRADIRIIAATNRDLGRAMAEGKFREDLFYRLNVFPLHLPPLRERLDDLPLLVEHFLRRYSARIGKRIDGASGALMARLRDYPWPGNVRELENILERAVILSETPILDLESTPLVWSPRTQAGEPAPTSRPTLQSVERDHIVATLVAHAWVIEGPTGAARTLGLHPNTLRSRMKKLGITRPT